MLDLFTPALRGLVKTLIHQFHFCKRYCKKPPKLPMASKLPEFHKKLTEPIHNTRRRLCRPHFL